ncbi:DUF4292 domain-containing protein [Sediminibacterium sp.]|uniref:DUF4292 domain-containing protein n=1 Tax=Sediminibacterium sp. TaxID=1917865 RepID=UPI0027276D2A|nr:DUF4292 domain-containing protein [Sediminibacterium sp.]MDO9000533.1 DUF4292 domain-containing protein [Bacteroidota bacterium]MDP3146899.1 DUF4292 domain-containing protein [Bacteroidota bacterium]MDP3567562.1 DUF4292 domain-containing protein [Sediminibacterium sp.]
MIKHSINIKLLLITALFVFLFAPSCKHREKTIKAQEKVINDTLVGRCKLVFKSAKTLSKNVKENEFDFDWLTAKANVESLVDGKEESFDIRVNIRKDSAMLVTIQYLLGIQVAKILITKDSVKMVNYIQKNYFRGDFIYINEMLNADLDFNVLQAVLFGNSAEFYEDDDLKLKPVTDRENCHYLLSTERKRRLKKLQSGDNDLKKALQILTLNPDNYKIIKNEFSDPSTNRSFIASYKNFTLKDSVYAPYHVDIDIVAEKKASIKIDYVRIEKKSINKLSLHIPPKYDEIQIQKK